MVCLLACFSTAQAFLFAQKVQSTRDLEAKERLLDAITAGFPDAGPALLQLAETTADIDTRWMAIRGIGTLKYEKAIPFLVESLLTKTKPEVADYRTDDTRNRKRA